MADNPGHLTQAFGNRELEQTFYSRPGVTLPTFIPPIIGFHAEEQMEQQQGEVGNTLNNGSHPRGTLGYRHSTPSSGGGNPGFVMEGFYDLFWKDRLHIVPTSQAFGSILSPVQGGFEVYNSGTKLGQHVRQVTSINDLSGLNINITSGLTSFPYTLGLGESSSYVYTVDADGPATINDSYDVGFDNGVTLSHFITGSRILLLRFRPQEPYTENWGWITDIIEKADGSEQRISVRDIPRLSIQHQYLYDDPLENMELENTLATRVPNQVALPIWRDYMTLTADVSIGDTVLPVNVTSQRQITVGQNIAIYNVSTKSFEVGTILTSGASSITLSSPLLTAWSTGDEVLPVRITNIRPWQQQKYAINAVNTSLAFDTFENYESTGDGGYPTYKSELIFTDPLLLVNGLTYVESWDQKADVVDFDTGRMFQQTLRTHPYIATQAYLLEWHDRTEFIRIRNFIMGRRGRQKRFWVPTNQPDLIVAGTTASGTTSIEVDASTNYEGIFNQGLRTELRITYLDDSVQYVGVSSITSGTPLQLNIDTTLDQECSVANVKQICFLRRMRFDQDDFAFQFRWYLDGEVRFTLKEIIS